MSTPHRPRILTHLWTLLALLNDVLAIYRGTTGDVELRARFAESLPSVWVPDEAVRKRVLVDNAEKLYGFERLAVLLLRALDPLLDLPDPAQGLRMAVSAGANVGERLMAEGEELVELATNWPLLEKLAAKSGGQVFAPDATCLGG